MMLLSSLPLWTVALTLLPTFHVSASMFEEMNTGALQMRGLTGVSDKYQGTNAQRFSRGLPPLPPRAFAKRAVEGQRGTRSLPPQDIRPETRMVVKRSEVVAIGHIAMYSESTLIGYISNAVDARGHATVTSGPRFARAELPLSRGTLEDFKLCPLGGLDLIDFEYEGTFSCLGASSGVRWPASDRLALRKGYRYLTGTLQDSESQLLLQISHVQHRNEAKESISFSIDNEGVIVPVWVDEEVRVDGEFFSKSGEGAFVGITRDWNALIEQESDDTMVRVSLVQLE